MKEIKHIIPPLSDYTLCWYAEDEFEAIYLDKSNQDIETIEEFIKNNYQDKFEFNSNCKQCIKILRG